MSIIKRSSAKVESVFSDEEDLKENTKKAISVEEVKEALEQAKETLEREQNNGNN